LPQCVLDHPRSDINAIDNYGRTALIASCENGHTDLVKLLLDHPKSENIDINAKDNYGYTALIRAFVQSNVVKLLLDHPRSENIDINAKNNQMKTGCEIAWERNKLEIVKLLKEYSKNHEEFILPGYM